MTKHLAQFLSTILFFAVLSCGGPEAPTNYDTTTTPQEAVTPTLAAPDCPTSGEMTAGNQVWLKHEDVLARIVGDSTTATENLGISQRILEIVDGRSCETLHRATLPANTSPDFPYYIADIQYSAGSRILGIRGYFEVLTCDLENDYQIRSHKPEFLTEREYGDAQSGSIRRLEVWENYLLGYATDCGAFAFSLDAANDIQPVLPFAEYQSPEYGDFCQLYLLPSSGALQAIMPAYDPESDGFQLNPLFDEPVQLSTNIQSGARDNQFLILREQDEARTPHAIDMAARKTVELPVEVAAQNTQEILVWLRSR
ncbi:MAG: hypothetical protein AAF840_18925 [Bacteroidota bacterium]